MATTGLVLSGGGTRCIAQLGIIKALQDFDIAISAFSGTSGGAVVSAFLSIGYTPEKITTIIRDSKLFDIKNFLFGKAGLFNMTLFEKVILEHFPVNSFEALPKPVYATATDILNGVPVYFSSGTLSTAIIASSCIPVVFEPIAYEDKMLVDGGVVNNFPIEPLIGKCDKIIGIYANAVSTNKKDLHLKDMLDRSLHFMMRHSITPKISQCDLYLEPPAMTHFSMFDFNRSEEIFKYGYDYAISQSERILAFKNS